MTAIPLEHLIAEKQALEAEIRVLNRLISICNSKPEPQEEHELPKAPAPELLREAASPRPVRQSDITLKAKVLTALLAGPKSVRQLERETERSYSVVQNYLLRNPDLARPSGNGNASVWSLTEQGQEQARSMSAAVV